MQLITIMAPGKMVNCVQNKDGTWPVPQSITCESRVAEKLVGHQIQGNPADGVHTYFFVFRLFKHHFNCYRPRIQEKVLTAYVINRFNSLVHNSSVPHCREMRGRLCITPGSSALSCRSMVTFITSCSVYLNTNLIDIEYVLSNKHRHCTNPRHCGLILRSLL